MKHRIITALLVIISILCYSTSAFASDNTGSDSINSSAYLSSYGVDLIADSNGVMAVEMSVNATGTMTKVGVLSLYIEQKVNGTWVGYDTVIGALHDDFYAYNTNVYLGEYEFVGTPGVQYRVTMTAYARNSSGYDTGNAYTGAVTCHNP